MRIINLFETLEVFVNFLIGVCYFISNACIVRFFEIDLWQSLNNCQDYSNNSETLNKKLQSGCDIKDRCEYDYETTIKLLNVINIENG